MAVVIHDDFWAAAQAMPEGQRAEFIYAICAYSFDGIEPDGDRAWYPTFIVIRDRIDMGAKASERGRAMANARWSKKHDAQADAQAYADAYAQADAHAYAHASETEDAEKEKEKEKEKRNTYCAPEVRRIVDFLNFRAGKSYKPSTPKTSRLIAARLKEGFAFEDFAQVIDKKCAEWLGTEMEKYLRPETLFGTKFEGYLNQGGHPRRDYIADYD